MRKQSGFTLVELLVVIAIIAVLMGILVPALAKSRRSAQRLQCANNLRLIGVATFAYANANNGFLPARYQADRKPKPAYNDYNMTFKPWDKATKAAYGLGLLFRAKFITDGRIFYCPSQRDNGFNVDAYTMPFLSDATQDYYTSYMYNPHHSDLSATPAAQVEAQFLKLAQMRKPSSSLRNPNAAGVTDFTGLFPVLAMEQIKSLQWTAHVIGEGAPAYNILYADGHVVTTVSKSASDMLKGFYANNNGGLATSGWQRFDRVLKALEQDSQK